MWHVFMMSSFVPKLQQSPAEPWFPLQHAAECQEFIRAITSEPRFAE